MTYWDGSWWDGAMGGGRASQQGGHGDPDGVESNDLTLVPLCEDCHNTDIPAGTHRNGILNSALRGQYRNNNTAHLKTFFFGDESLPEGVQVNFDQACWTRCHQGLGRKNHRHSRDGDLVVRFGVLGTRADADGTRAALPYPVDSDLTTRASTADPDFAPCVACHDPHGTGVLDAKGGVTGPRSRNVMLRDVWWSYPNTLCRNCHAH
jgi:hypothetical protein